MGLNDGFITRSDFLMDGGVTASQFVRRTHTTATAILIEWQLGGILSRLVWGWVGF